MLIKICHIILASHLRYLVFYGHLSEARTPHPTQNCLRSKVDDATESPTGYGKIDYSHNGAFWGGQLMSKIARTKGWMMSGFVFSCVWRMRPR